VASRPASGDTGLRGLVDVLLELVADAVVAVRLGGLAHGPLLLARGGLRLLVGGVGALTACSSFVREMGTCGPASFLSALAAMSLCELQRVAGIRWLDGTTSRVACCSAAITISARP
jgi:hypothetical protein